MRRYQNGSYGQLKQEATKKDGNKDEKRESNPLQERSRIENNTIVELKRPQVTSHVQETSTKSGKKIKFEVTSNKENIVPSVSKQEAKPKSNEKNPKKLNKKGLSSEPLSKTGTAQKPKNFQSNKGSRTKLTKAVSK